MISANTRPSLARLAIDQPRPMKISRLSAASASSEANSIRTAIANSTPKWARLSAATIRTARANGL